MSRVATLLGAVLLVAACGRPTSGAAPLPVPSQTAAPAAGEPAGADATATTAVSRDPLLPPLVAFNAGLMPLQATGVLDFRATRPTADGRGVVLAILDSGIDPGTAGLITTSTGAAKIADLRDFSGEGRVALVAVTPQANGTVDVDGRPMAGAGRVSRLAVGDKWYAGVFRELPLGRPPASDVNGNGTDTDVFPLVVVRASDGWVVFLDSNGDGSFDDEQPLHDYRFGHETIALGTRPLTLAANFADTAGTPRLDLYFDTLGHGTAVAGVAAGHNLFNVRGFHGVAPGATVLGLKIANNARGGISVTGSFLRALDYAAGFAAAHGQPLVANLSFGVGNEPGARATIDSLIDAFLARHPDVTLVVSAGNDGPGVSTVGFPATADRALSVGSTLPGAFAKPGGPAPPDRVGAWSARGGVAAQPRLLAPGVAFSAVPPWNAGNEINVGTSFSAPHVAGLAACLISALLQDGRRVDAAAIEQALVATAEPLADGSALDGAAGLPRLDAAYRWLTAGHQGSLYATRARSGWSAAMRRDGLADAGDTVEVFTVWHLAGLRAGRFVLRSDAAWLRFPDTVLAQTGGTEIPVTYRAGALRAGGLHVGTVTGRNPGDTLAGPLFALVNTVVVPHNLAARPLLDERRGVSTRRVERYFLRVPFAGATLRASVTLPDSAGDRVTASLFEPGGRPFRDAPNGIELDATRGTAEFTVRADDIVPGVYELAIVTAPLGPPATATITVRAALAPLALAAAPEIELSNPGDVTRTVRVAQQVVGAERVVQLQARGAAAETLTVRVPPWARTASIDVSVTPSLWAEFTDLGVTVFDSTGRQIGQQPQNYARGRQTIPLDSTRVGRPLAVEVFPAWADPDAVHPWSATLTVRFLTSTGLTVGEPRDVRVVAGGRVAIPRAGGTPGDLPEAFAPLLAVTADPMSGPVALRWVHGTVP